MKDQWEDWNEAFLYPLALILFAVIYSLADLFLGITGGLQPLGYYIGPMFLRPAFFLLAGLMATLAFKFNRPELYEHTKKHMKKVLNEAFQAPTTERKEANLNLDDLWAKRGHYTWLWLYTLALAILALANF
jgi:hypothetical protein